MTGPTLRGLCSALAPLPVLALALAAPLAAHADDVPTFAAIQAAHQPSDLRVLDRHGAVVQTVRVDKTVRRLPWVPLADVSPALVRAVVLSEDHNFYAHSGIDWSAVASSAWEHLVDPRIGPHHRGASTLTMQLAGLVDDDLARPAGGRSVAQKLGQAWMAERIEARWTKREILEAYLNRVTFRGETVGIGALSQTLFGKWPSGLDVQEAAIAAALLRGPNAAPARVAKRACGVLREERLSCVGIEALTLTALARKPGMPLGNQLAPHFARQLLAAAPDGTLRPQVRAATARRAAAPTTLRSTLDARVQRLAIDALRCQLAELANRNVEDGAVLVLDNASGDVLAWVGSSGSASDAPEVDGVLARRQPGSTLKPFVYELAFEQRLLTPASLLDDAPTQIATGSGLYVPQNYDHDFKGWVSARTALGSSLNVPAVRTATLVGIDALFERLNALGFALPESGGYYGASLALGSADVSLFALTNAYRTLANGGVTSPLRGLVAVRPRGTAERRVMPAAPVALVTDILADNSARVPTFGLDSVLATRGFAAVKTGTSKDLRDNWCVGYTDRYTVGVWVGNASGAPMHAVSGVSGAAPVWQALVRALHEAAPSQPPAKSPGLVLARPALGGAAEADRDEWFLAGTEPRDGLADASDASDASRGGLRNLPPQTFGIALPREGSVFALDPDMPATTQRIRFEGEPGNWVLDGKRLGSGAHWSWPPQPGRHTLALVDADGEPLGSPVHFEVRGASLKTAPRTGTPQQAPGPSAQSAGRVVPPALPQQSAAVHHLPTHPAP